MRKKMCNVSTHINIKIIIFKTESRILKCKKEHIKSMAIIRRQKKTTSNTDNDGESTTPH
jgi:hypothetical protein